MKMSGSDSGLPTLHLNVKGIYFNEMRCGNKPYEYRLRSKWAKRIEGRTFGKILIKHGYPAKGDLTKVIERPWRGYEIQTITHPHFGPDPVEVIAIRVQ